jgi:aspartate racemase
MGPEATVELMRRVIAATPAKDDADHIHMIVDNNPGVPSRIAALIDGDGENPGPCIAEMARRLEGAGADLLVIPCNTAHCYYRYAADAVSIPVVHLIDLTLDAIATQGSGRRVGMLASTAVQRVGLYEQRGGAAGFEFVFPERQAEVLRVIREIKSGPVGDDAIRTLDAAGRELVAAGASGLVLACTELSLVADRLDTPVPVYDTLAILVDEIVRLAGPAGA